MTMRIGVWVFFNQADNQDWPTFNDGPFRCLWQDEPTDCLTVYGKVHSAGGGTGGARSGVPFAIVELSAAPSWATDASPVGYRYGEGWLWTPCPKAAYCWAEGTLDVSALPTDELTDLLDLEQAGGKFVVQALLQLYNFIQDEFAQHSASGTFQTRAARGRRSHDNATNQWTRRGEVADQLKQVLENHRSRSPRRRQGEPEVIPGVNVPPRTFLQYGEAYTIAEGRFHEFVLGPSRSPVPKVRTQWLKNEWLSVSEIRALVLRPLKADVWKGVQNAPASPCLAGYVPPGKPRSIFLSDPAMLKKCSQKSSKSRLVWVCEWEVFGEALNSSRIRGLPERGYTSLVASESMDGGRIRVVADLPLKGKVIVKLLMPVFAQQFIYWCLKAAPEATSPALASLLALAYRPRGEATNPLNHPQLRPAPAHDNDSGSETSEGEIVLPVEEQRKRMQSFDYGAFPDYIGGDIGNPQSGPDAAFATPPLHAPGRHVTTLSSDQRRVARDVINSSKPVQAIWSIAGAGKSRILSRLLEQWRWSAKTPEALVWVMVPKQALRQDIFERVKRSMGPGEFIIWGSHDEYEDYLDDFLCDAIDRELAGARGVLDELDRRIELETDRARALDLHRKRYEWLRREYLEKQGDVATKVLSKVRGVVLTVDLAIKILGGLSRKHRALVNRGIGLGLLDEVHNVSRDQIICLAAHIPCLVVAGDPFQNLRFDRPGDCGSAVEWLKANVQCHHQEESWRYGSEVLSLLALEKKSGEFSRMIRSARCRPGSSTKIRAFAFHSLRWEKLRDGSVWRCQALFAFLFALAVEAREYGCHRVAVITDYDRIRVAWKAFLAKVRPLFPGKVPASLVVLTPGESSGSNVDGAIVLGAHRRTDGEEVWHGGHQAQVGRRYVALTRASRLLSIVVEGPGPFEVRPRVPDTFWMDAAKTFEGRWQELQLVESLAVLDWGMENRVEFADKCAAAYESVDWKAAEAELRTSLTAAPPESFFSSCEQMRSETRALTWNPRVPLPVEADGYARKLDLAPTTEPAQQAEGPVPEPDPETSPEATSPKALLYTQVVLPAMEVVGRWKEAMVPSCTIIVNGPDSAFMDFNFVPQWLPGEQPENMQQAFEGFIASLFVLVGFEGREEQDGGRYLRRIDYHKLEVEPGMEGYTYFFRHCWSTRLCIKLIEKDGDKLALYGYNGMGLHLCHHSWKSLVIRSRSAALTARLLSVLEAPCSQEHFVDGVPEGCSKTYTECIGFIQQCLAHRGVVLPGVPEPRPPGAQEASGRDGDEDSEGGGLNGGDPDDDRPNWNAD